MIILLSQGPVRKRNLRDVGQGVDLVVDDSSILPIGKPTDILGRDPLNDLSDNLFPLATYDHIDIRTTVEQVLDLLRRFVPSDDGADLRRQLGNEITDFFESRFPSDTHTEQIDIILDELAECLRVLVGLLMPKVKKRHLPDQVFHACGNVFQSGRGENPDECGRIPKIGIKRKSVFVFHHARIIAAKNRRCKGMRKFQKFPSRSIRVKNGNMCVITVVGGKMLPQR
jgi:uncharacterized protein (DUF2267 family)